MEAIELTQVEKFSLFVTINSRIEQLKEYIEVRTGLIEFGCADPDDKHRDGAELEVKVLKGILEKIGY